MSFAQLLDEVESSSAQTITHDYTRLRTFVREESPKVHHAGEPLEHRRQEVDAVAPVELLRIHDLALIWIEQGVEPGV